MKTKIKALVIEVLAELILGESVDCDDCLISNKFGGVSERFKELVLKTSDRVKPTVGSNPTLSAMYAVSYRQV